MKRDSGIDNLKLWQKQALIVSLTRLVAEINAGNSRARATVLISEATRQTATGISRSAITATQLAAFADDLNGSVASFMLSAQRRGTGRLRHPTGSHLRPISVEEWGSGQYFTQN